MIEHAPPAGYLALPPHPLLRPYIAGYTLTFPSPQLMPEAYTVLPSASATMIISADDRDVYAGVNGATLRARQVGGYAIRMRMLLLVEFRPDGLYPLLRIGQDALAGRSEDLAALDAPLARAMREALLRAGRPDELVAMVDGLLLARLMDAPHAGGIAPMLDYITRRHGNASIGTLADAFCYSEKQVRRLFLRHVGANPKAFARIVRVNHAIRMLQGPPAAFADVAARAGFFDQPHFIHDFKAICGVTPQAYLRDASIYYNDEIKL